MELNQISEKIIGCAFTVHNTLGIGFLEKVYENALAIELKKANLQIEQQKRSQVFYNAVVVGEYYIDLLVENEIAIELKSTEELHPRHQAQLINYLRADNLRLGLLLNFSKTKLEIKRIRNGD